MPRVIEIVIRGSDLSGPAFASAATNLARLTQGSGGTATGLARVETQAHATGSAIITLGIAGSTTQTRMRSLTVSIVNQEQALGIAARRLAEVRSAHDADSLAVGRAQLAYDRLNRTLANNRARMQDLRTSGDVSGISVAGVGGAAAGQKGSMLGTALAGLGGDFLAIEAGRRGAQFIQSSLEVANAFSAVDTSVRSLAGSEQVYSDTLAVALRNQERQGGSLADQLTSMTALLPLLRTTNAEMTTLNTTQQLLALRTPTEGAGGAAFALQEYLTSTTAEGSRSLTERFNLPKTQLNDILQQTQGDAEARLQAVITLLQEQGIDAKTLEDQATNAAAPFRQLSAAWSNFYLREGQAAQRVLGPLARLAAGGLNLISSSPNIGQVASGDLSGWSARTGYVGTSGPQAAPIVQHITVQGSLVTERQLADTTRRLTTQTAARNGVQTRR